MIIGTTSWFFVGGDQPSELQRLERLVGILLTIHALRSGTSRYVIKHVCLLQMITGLTLEWSVEDWLPSAASLLTAFVQARVAHDN